MYCERWFILFHWLDACFVNCEMQTRDRSSCYRWFNCADRVAVRHDSKGRAVYSIGLTEAGYRALPRNSAYRSVFDKSMHANDSGAVGSRLQVSIEIMDTLDLRRRDLFYWITSILSVYFGWSIWSTSSCTRKAGIWRIFTL